MSLKRYEALDGWRGIAALAIAFYHVPIAHPLRDFDFWKNMEFFVDFFFVLSGFVIMHAWGARLATPQDATRFMTRRFWRIWPLHIAVLSIFVIIEVLKLAAGFMVSLPVDDAPFTQGRSIAALISNIGLVQSLNLHGGTTWNGPAWSISVEFWAYALFALLMVLARGKTAALALVVVVSVMILFWLSPNLMFSTHDFGLFRATYGFFVGVLAYRLCGYSESAPSGTGLEITAIGSMLIWLILTGANFTSLFAPIVFAGVVIVFANSAGSLNRFVTSKPVQALGLWSYSIYLVHVLLFYCMRLALVLAEKVLKVDLTASGSGNERIFTSGSGIIDGAWIVAMLAVSVVLSSWTYLNIEKRYMNSSLPQPLNAKPQPVQT